MGPIIGGAIAQHTTWRWIFYLMLPLCATGLIAIPLLLTIRPRVTSTMGQKLRRVDWAGSAAFMASATLFLIAISWGGTQHAWSSAATLGPLIAGTAGLVATALWERLAAAEPLLQHSLFASPSAAATYACSAAQGLLLFGQLYYIPFYFMAALGYDPLRTGVALLPVMLTLVPASIIAGALITRTSAYQLPMWTGWAFCAVGCGVATTWDDRTPQAVWAVTLVVLGLGHGAVLNSQNFAAQAICGAGDEAAAAAAYAFMRHLGTALGVGVGASAFQNFIARGLRDRAAAAGLAVGALNGWAENAEAWVPLLRSLDAASEERAVVMGGYVDGFRGVFRVYLGVCLAAMLASLLVRRYDMNKELASEHKLRENKLSIIIDSRLGKASSRVPAGAAEALARALAVVDEEAGEGQLPGSDASSQTEVDMSVPAPVMLAKKETEGEEEDEQHAADHVVKKPDLELPEARLEICCSEGQNDRPPGPVRTETQHTLVAASDQMED